VLPHDVSEGATLRTWAQGLALPLFAATILLIATVIG